MGEGSKIKKLDYNADVVTKRPVSSYVVCSVFFLANFLISITLCYFYYKRGKNMGEIIFSAENLIKQYKTNKALNDFYMEIHRGEIYGFVGRNGAGKTTLMRILTGRAKQTDGRLALFGISGGAAYSKQLRKVGALIESPTFYSGLTAWDNLEILRLQYGIPGTTCISEVLEMVGLEDVGKKKVKNFSLGMKQRLGLAQAILGNREFLVLDEPTNGMDPEGIIDFRKILISLNQERGVTILISSHMLKELSQLATCYGFIRKGKMVRESTIEEIKKECMAMPHLSIYTDNAMAAFKIMKEDFPQYKAKVASDDKLVIDGFSGGIKSNDVKTVIKSLIEKNIEKSLIDKNIEIKEVKIEHANIEDLYLAIMNRER